MYILTIHRKFCQKSRPNWRLERQALDGKVEQMNKPQKIIKLDLEESNFYCYPNILQLPWKKPLCIIKTIKFFADNLSAKKIIIKK